MGNALVKMFQAIDQDDKSLVEHILEQKPEALNLKNEHGFTPLYRASVKGRVAIARYLLERGADIEAADKNGNRAIHQAAKNGDREMLELLLGHGANFEVKNNARHTPLYYAADGGHTAIQLRLQAAETNGSAIGSSSGGEAYVYNASALGHSPSAPCMEAVMTEAVPVDEGTYDGVKVQEVEAQMIK